MLIVLVLTNESDSALSIVLVKSRHVEIIDKVDELVLANWSVNLTSSTLKLLFKNSLKQHGVSVIVEVDDLLEVVLSLGRQIIEETLSDLSLTATG